MSVSREVSEASLLRAITHGTEHEGKGNSTPIKEILEIATQKERIVPIAMLLTTGLFSSVEVAQQALRQDPIIRNVIKKFTKIVK